jgi:hypothetical protein
MKSIKESIRKHIAIMEDAHKPELSLYKAINKYFKEFGHERGMNVLEKILMDISKKHGPSQVTDKSVGPKSIGGVTIHEMMNEEDESVEDIGDSLLNSEKFEEILNTTYSSDFSDEFEYADNIIYYLISDYVDTEIEEELIDYIKDVYGYQLLDLYRSGNDDDDDGDDDLEYFI